MHTTTKRTIVDTDTRRNVFMLAKARKPGDIAKMPHEAFIRNELKTRLGWPRREPAPDAIKAVARQMAAQFNAEMLAKSKAAVAAREKEAANQAAAAQDIFEAAL
jgi:hypothetical protein